MNEKENELLVKLRPMFDHMLSYQGDDELISSCNDEYIFDPDQVIVTDGMINTRMQKSTNHPNGTTLLSIEIVELITSIRGASYVIICTIKENEYNTDLRVDRSSLDEDVFNKIIKSLEEIKEKYHSMRYYINDYIDKRNVLPNPTDIDDLLEEV